MSIEYEVRSDDRYSRRAPIATVREFLVTEYAARPEGDLLIYDRDGCLIEISFGCADQDPNALEYVGFRIPASARLKSADRAVRMGLAVAERLSWRVFDPQQGDYIGASQLEPGPPLGDALAQLVQEVRRESGAQLLHRLWRRARRQSLSSIGQLAFGGLFAAIVAGWLFGFRPYLRPILSLGIIAAVTILLVAGDIVLDVLGEVHTEAEAARKVAPDNNQMQLTKSAHDQAERGPRS